MYIFFLTMGCVQKFKLWVCEKNTCCVISSCILYKNVLHHIYFYYLSTHIIYVFFTRLQHFYSTHPFFPLVYRWSLISHPWWDWAELFLSLCAFYTHHSPSPPTTTLPEENQGKTKKFFTKETAGMVRCFDLALQKVYLGFFSLLLLRVV